MLRTVVVSQTRGVGLEGGGYPLARRPRQFAIENMETKTAWDMYCPWPCTAYVCKQQTVPGWLPRVTMFH